MNINQFLDEALKLAKITYKNWNYPIWALLIVNNEIVWFWENKVFSEKNHSYHAEIDLINKSKKYKNIKWEKILIVTMEPCNNCAKALVEFWVDEVYYIVEDPSWWGKNILNLAWIKTQQIKYKYEEYLDLIIEFMKKHWWYNEVLSQYISIKQNGENLYQKELNNFLQTHFINISQDIRDYNIRKIVYNNTLHYLKTALLKTSKEKHQIVLNWYVYDTNKIIKYCEDNFINNYDNKLKIDFIKWLHKNLFPEWFIAKNIDVNWKEFVQMIPWEYRNINLHSKTNENKNIYSKWQNVENLLEKIVDNYNKSQKQESDILLFLTDFSRVHPFGDGNWRTIDILVDLLLLKNWFFPLYLWELKQKDEIWFYKVLDRVYESRDVKYFYEFLERFWEKKDK